MPNDSKAPESAHTANFIRHHIERDLAEGKYAGRRWGGKPGTLDVHKDAPIDPAKIRTRFPPEPNGYLHIGHAKSICLNFGAALDFGGVCHMRFDDTNPEKEEQEYVDAILDSVHWLGYHWGKNDENLYHASDYFDWMYQFAEELIKHGDAYVDSQTAEELRATRGSLTEHGLESPYRTRSVDENLKLFGEMRDGKHPDGSHVLRARIDMKSPNINMRDPALYRIKHAEHHRTGNKWAVYPMYSYAHPIEDALENITHSLCTLEFEDQRPFYDWVLDKIASFGLLQRPLPQQIEFSRLNLTYTVMSKRFLIQLVKEGHVDGWDDPRMPTIVGVRRRGYTPEGLRLFMDRIGVSKSDSVIEYSVLEDAQREVLNEIAPRRIAVLDPLKLVIDNWPKGHVEEAFAPNHPQKPDWGKRSMPLTGELWIEREDFMEAPSKGYFRLYPGNQVRLKYGYVVRCTGYSKDERTGQVTEVHCEYLPETKSGTPGADAVKVKGNIHWVSAAQAYETEVRLYDRLFNVPNPGKRTGNYLDDLNPNCKVTLRACLEPSLKDTKDGERFQFERHGYFVTDPDRPSPGEPVFSRTLTLRDSWAADQHKQTPWTFEALRAHLPSDVAAALADLESDQVERTESTTDTDKFCEAICAFANDLPDRRTPGFLFVGVKDKGGLSGLSVSDKLLTALAALRLNGQIQPIPSMDVAKYQLPEGDMAVVKVFPSDLPPVRYKGRICVRVGPARAFATEMDERRLYEKRVSKAKTFDVEPAFGTSTTDLAVELFRTSYLPEAVSREVLEENHRSVEQQLASLRFFDPGLMIPTNAGILLFGKDPTSTLPGAYVQFVRYDGLALDSNVIDEKVISGDLASVLRSLEALIKSQVTRYPRAESEFRETDTQDYPFTALRELLMNAVMHRSYQSTAPTRVNWFSDHVEIQSPGGLFGEADLANFPRVTSYRNPVIAEAIKTLGFVNKFGRGVARAIADLRANGNAEPRFEIVSTYFSVSIQRRT